MRYYYDLDEPDEPPVPEEKMCFKAGGEVALSLGSSSSSGGILPGKKELFLRIGLLR